MSFEVHQLVFDLSTKTLKEGDIKDILLLHVILIIHFKYESREFLSIQNL